MRRRDEDGQTTVLIVGFALVLVMAVAMVVDVSAAYLQRQGLDTVADGAALRAADLGATGEEVYAGGVPSG
ncbi:pilus assembly protein TadG-related protein, partial [Nocardioides hankookensis]